MSFKPFVCGNWKLNHGLQKTREVVQQVAQGSSQFPGVEIAVAPVAPFLFAALDASKNSALKIASQNVFYETSGAFTGEWSADQLKELGCHYAIVGHSERRQYFAEDDESVGKKVKACLRAGVTPIACLGESLAQRENGQLEEVLHRQVMAITKAAAGATTLVIAYEPIWAIGTGKTATPSQAQEVHKMLRGWSGGSIALLYGGSVKADNAGELIRQPDIDGFLIGGASLEAGSFLDIVQAVNL